MKNVSTLLLLLIIATSIFSQQTQPVEKDYLRKSKNQKKTAWVMLGGGATLVLTSFIIPRGECIDWNPIGGYEYENDGIKSIFFVVGSLSMLGSIPFFISSNHNKKRVAAFSFKNESARQLVKSNFVYKTVPSLSIRLNL